MLSQTNVLQPFCLVREPRKTISHDPLSTPIRTNIQQTIFLLVIYLRYKFQKRGFIVSWKLVLLLILNIQKRYNIRKKNLLFILKHI